MATLIVGIVCVLFGAGVGGYIGYKVGMKTMYDYVIEINHEEYEKEDEENE